MAISAKYSCINLFSNFIINNFGIRILSLYFEGYGNDDNGAYWFG